jgi:hypothetical protein
MAQAGAKVKQRTVILSEGLKKSARRGCAVPMSAAGFRMRVQLMVERYHDGHMWTLPISNQQAMDKKVDMG